MEMEKIEKIKIKGWRLDKTYKRYQEDVTVYQMHMQESFSKHNAAVFFAFGVVFLLMDLLIKQSFDSNTLFCFGISVLSTTNYVLHKNVLPKHRNWIVPVGNVYILILGKCLMSFNLVGNGAVSWTLLLCALISTSFVILFPHYYITILIVVLGLDMAEDVVVSSQMVDVMYHLLDDLIISSFCIGINIIFSKMKYQELEQEESLHCEMQLDPLTRLYNRRYMENYFEGNAAWKGLSAILMLDLDNFKKANDVFGHKAGDEVLCQVAEILRNNFREDDCVARLGGDEFLVFLPKVTNREVVMERVERVLQSFPILLQGEKPVEVSVSIGVVFKEEGKTPSYSQLCDSADEAMYKAKKSGKGKAVIAA